MYKMTGGKGGVYTYEAYEAKRRPKGRHPLFCFTRELNPYSPLTASHFVHYFYINKTIDGFDNWLKDISL